MFSSPVLANPRFKKSLGLLRFAPNVGELTRAYHLGEVRSSKAICRWMSPVPAPSMAFLFSMRCSFRNAYCSFVAWYGGTLAESICSPGLYGLIESCERYQDRYCNRLEVLR